MSSSDSVVLFRLVRIRQRAQRAEKMLTAAAAKECRVKYKGTYAPDNKKFHFVSMFETESYDRLMEILMDPKNPPRITRSSLMERLRYSAVH